ncbi:30S ribosomal protein S2 [Candidatus Azambacteria bacterium]|nr:30S ribosomal protein S2 [Candidatus Azambacteria bacterium]
METQTSSANRTGMLQKMLEVGTHLGHKKSKGHPKMKPYLFATRQNIQIINVEKTLEKLQEAKAFLREVASKGGVVLFAATKVPGKLLIKDAAMEAGMPFVQNRWLGGTFTNFPILLKRLEYFIGQEHKRKQGAFEKYPKKEQVLLVREIESLEKKMGGLKQLKKLPDALIVVDIDEHISAVREAKKMNVATIAISGTNTDPTKVTYPIPANNRSALSVSLLLNELVSAINEGRQKTEIAL